MLIKAITYTNYNGEKKTKNFYFNLTKSEISRMEFMSDGGLAMKFKKMFETQDKKELFAYFEEFILDCYGEKSEDGELFIKNDDVREKFRNHPAYDVLIMEFLTGGEKAMADFVNAVIPSDLQDNMKNTDPEVFNKLVGFDVINANKAEG